MNSQSHRVGGLEWSFQYPLCRIVGVNDARRDDPLARRELSVSALSDRWCELDFGDGTDTPDELSVSALSDRWCEPVVGAVVALTNVAFSIRSVGSLV